MTTDGKNLSLKAPPQVIEVKEVHTWDGGDRHKYSHTMTGGIPDAELKAAWPHCTIVQKMLVIHSSIESVKEYTQLAIRQRVWDKLTPLERDALGMKERP